MTYPTIPTTSAPTATPAQEIADAIIHGLTLAIVQSSNEGDDEGSRLYRAIMASALADIWPHGSEAPTSTDEPELTLTDAINLAWAKAGAADAVWFAFPTPLAV